MFTFSNDKFVVVIGGPNGSGKSTLARGLLDRGHIPLYLNPDETTESPLLKPQHPLSAGKLHIRERDRLIGQGASFGIETTFAGRDAFRFLQNVKTQGYRIFIVYSFLDNSDLCIERINVRVQSGGHYVPDNTVKKRFSRSAKNFWHVYRLFADQWALLYNGEQLPSNVAAGRADEITVQNDTLFNVFMGVLDGE